MAKREKIELNNAIINIKYLNLIYTNKRGKNVKK